MSITVDTPAAAAAPLTTPADSQKTAAPSSKPSSDFDPTADFQGDLPVNDDSPTQAELDKVADLVVLGEDGSSVPFKSLYSGEGKATRGLVIFIRHFFCGYCQEFVRSLVASVTPDALVALPKPTFIAVVGCGRPELIRQYITETNCPFPVYADPSRKLYDSLHMTKTLSLGPRKPEYVRRSMMAVVVKSFIQSIKSGTNGLKGGDYNQVGGEFMFEDGKITWCHRMRNTRDHAEISTLRKVLGLAADEAIAAAPVAAPTSAEPAPTSKQSKRRSFDFSRLAANASETQTQTSKQNKRRSLDLSRLLNKAKKTPSTDNIKEETEGVASSKGAEENAANGVLVSTVPATITADAPVKESAKISDVSTPSTQEPTVKIVAEVDSPGADVAEVKGTQESAAEATTDEAEVPTSNGKLSQEGSTTNGKVVAGPPDGSAIA